MTPFEEHDEWEHFMRMEHGWKSALPPGGTRYWLTIFPEAKRAAARGTRARIAELKHQTAEAEAEREDLMNRVVMPAHFKKQDSLRYAVELWCGWRAAAIQKELKDAERDLIYINNISDEKEVVEKRDEITAERVERAKQYPMEEMVDFIRRSALCIFHDDRKPSMYYYPKTNHVYCFSCSHRADAIEVYMKLNGTTFHQAVRAMAS